MRTDPNRGDPMNDLDLVADLNAQDDDGLGWSTLADAHAPERVRPGAMLLAGNSQAQAVVREYMPIPAAMAHVLEHQKAIAEGRQPTGA